MAQALILTAAHAAKRKGIARDRVAATMTDLGAWLMVAEVGPMGAAEILRQIADRIELGDAEAAGYA